MPDLKQLNIRLPKDLIMRVKLEALMQDMPVLEYVRLALEEKLDRDADKGEGHENT